jgi:hypothetical protein
MRARRDVVGWRLPCVLPTTACCSNSEMAPTMCVLVWQTLYLWCNCAL